MGRWKPIILGGNIGGRVEANNFWEVTLVGGWKQIILGGNIGGRVEANNFGREHWWEGGI